MLEIKKYRNLRWARCDCSMKQAAKKKKTNLKKPEIRLIKLCRLPMRKRQLKIVC
jgi:hypothetical protein